VCQVVLAYRVLADDNGFDLAKDVFQGQLVPVDNMPNEGVILKEKGSNEVAEEGSNDIGEGLHEGGSTSIEEGSEEAD